MKENVTVFTKSAIFYFSVWSVFGSFSNQITQKVVTENKNCYFYHVENISSRNVFFVFSPNLKFFRIIKEKSHNFDFFQEKHIFLHFFVKNSKNIRLG